MSNRSLHHPDQMAYKRGWVNPSWLTLQIGWFFFLDNSVSYNFHGVNYKVSCLYTGILGHCLNVNNTSIMFLNRTEIIISRHIPTVNNNTYQLNHFILCFSLCCLKSLECGDSNMITLVYRKSPIMFALD